MKPRAARSPPSLNKSAAIASSHAPSTGSLGAARRSAPYRGRAQRKAGVYVRSSSTLLSTQQLNTFHTVLLSAALPLVKSLPSTLSHCRLISIILKLPGPHDRH